MVFMVEFQVCEFLERENFCLPGRWAPAVLDKWAAVSIFPRNTGLALCLYVILNMSPSDQPIALSLSPLLLCIVTVS